MGSAEPRPRRMGLYLVLAAIALAAGSIGALLTTKGIDSSRASPPRTTDRPPAASPATPPPSADPPAVIATEVEPPPAGPFLVDFAGNTGLERFDTGVYHRDDDLVATTTWSGDHDLACGTPDTQRTIHRNHPDESFYLCRDHLMTSVGDTSGYSIAWFTPKQTFTRTTTRTVAWDVNITDLDKRQWWEVSIVPDGAPFLATIDWLAGTANIDTYDPASIIVGTGPFGNDVNITTQGDNQYDGWQSVCGTWGIDPDACASKAIRRPFSITDNGNDTLTINYAGRFTQTVPGRFPDSFRVYFKDHNYTPDKDGTPIGHTWHWDNIAIT